MIEEGETTCCYAQSEKSWIDDPQGVQWETFLTTGESTVYGTDEIRSARKSDKPRQLVAHRAAVRPKLHRGDCPWAASPVPPETHRASAGFLSPADLPTSDLDRRQPRNSSSPAMAKMRSWRQVRCRRLGESALLRSVVVAAELRGTGLGRSDRARARTNRARGSCEAADPADIEGKATSSNARDIA